MRFVALIACLTLAACQRTAAPAEQASEQHAGPITEQRSNIEGWDNGDYALLGSVLPDFKAKRTGGGAEVTQENLRDHWTILGVFDEPRGDEESRYISALSSAADQDPDLDVMWIYTDLNETANKTASLIDGKDLATTLHVDKTPAYLLIGPDLAIEAHRGALSATPQDGIKPMIRGIAEIRKQIAAPG